jgi:prevent-host-death family protein
MAEPRIPQRELRNNIGAVLRQTAAGATFTVTVHGKPMARLVPPAEASEPRVDVDRESLRRILAIPVDEDFQRDVEAAEAPIDNPWREA